MSLTLYLVVAGLQDEIQAANEKFMDAYNKGDMNALSALYTEDCKLMPTGSDVVNGRDGKSFLRWY